VCGKRERNIDRRIDRQIEECINIAQRLIDKWIA
jgi:hypothetical protein